MNIIAFITVFLSSTAYAATSPFTDVKYDSLPSITVEVEGKDYFLLALNGVRRKEIIDKCSALYGESCGCMFAEKFSEMMDNIGFPIDDQVTAKLYRFQGHQISTVTLNATEENTETILDNRFDRDELCYE